MGSDEQVFRKNKSAHQHLKCAELQSSPVTWWFTYGSYIQYAEKPKLSMVPPSAGDEYAPFSKSMELSSMWASWAVTVAPVKSARKHTVCLPGRVTGKPAIERLTFRPADVCSYPMSSLNRLLLNRLGQQLKSIPREETKTSQRSSTLSLSHTGPLQGGTENRRAGLSLSSVLQNSKT